MNTISWNYQKLTKKPTVIMMILLVCAIVTNTLLHSTNGIESSSSKLLKRPRRKTFSIPGSYFVENGDTDIHSQSIWEEFGQVKSKKFSSARKFSPWPTIAKRNSIHTKQDIEIEQNSDLPISNIIDRLLFWDEGLSLSLSLSINFQPTASPSKPFTPTRSPTSHSGNCDINPKCSDLNLQGDCCPAADGVFLDCCEKSPQSRPSFTPISVPSAIETKKPLQVPSLPTTNSCSTIPACKALGLDGNCCPTPDGVFLDCCRSPPSAPISYVPFTSAPVGSPLAPAPVGSPLAPAPVGSPLAPAPSAPIAGSTTCASNPKCNALKLEGDCCPTSDGVYLGCCDTKPGSPPGLAPATSPSASGTCSSVPACNALGLKGDCCPTTFGVNLDCCGSLTLAPVASKPIEPLPTASSGTCSSKPKCAALNLEGDCCPTSDGVFLDCCDGHVPKPSAMAPVAAPFAQGTCASNQACNALGLKGDCCPTPNGVFLNCCGSTPSLPVTSAPIVSKPATMAGTCSSNLKCAALNLEGDCCPASDGVFLDCCDSKPVSPSETAPATAPSTQGTCRSKPACTALGLQGDCCPTKDGIFLDCCQMSPSAPVGSAPVASTPTAGFGTCSSNSKCAALNLEGDCCPTSDGAFLDCCDSKPASPSELPPVTAPSAQGTCSSKPACMALGLQGDCCPTIDGIFLHCCQASPSTPIESAPVASTPTAGLGTCSLNSKCAALNLEGDCCPTADGAFLDCCNAKPASPSELPPAKSPLAQGTCSSKPACKALGLEGDCCPTTDGIFLDCCQASPSTPIVSMPTVFSDTCSSHPKCAALNLEGACCPTPKGVLLGCCLSVLSPSANELSPASSPMSLPSIMGAPSDYPEETNSPTETNTFDQNSFDRASAILKKCGVTEENRTSSLLSLYRNISDAIVLNNESSPEFIAATWLDQVDEFIVCPNQTNELYQRYALVATYHYLWGPNWFNCSDSFASECRGEMRWLSSSNECLWFGITCNAHGVVTGISLKRNNLTGLIPQIMFTLHGLTSISLDHNSISGTIPKDFDLLQNLEVLELDDNQIHGSIPSSMYDIISLKALDLNLNHLTGTIPEEIGNLPNLMVLQVENNKLSGTIPWFGLAMDQELLVLYLHNNSFSDGASLEPICRLLSSRRETNPGYLQFLAADCNVDCSCCSECF